MTSGLTRNASRLELIRHTVGALETGCKSSFPFLCSCNTLQLTIFSQRHISLQSPIGSRNASFKCEADVTRKICHTCMGWSQRVINFPWIFYAMRSFVPVGHFRNISGHLFTWLVCGSLQWCHGLSFTDCIAWDDKDKVIGFKRPHWIHLGWWSTGSPKLQLFQLSQHSHVTNCRLISSSAYFPWNMTSKYKMQPSEGSWNKILHCRSRT